MAHSIAVQTIGADDDPPFIRTLLANTTDDAPPDAGALEAFLKANGATPGPDGLWNVGRLKDEDGTVTGWRAEIDADETAVNAAMKQWAAPVNPAPALEATLATSLAGLMAGADAGRTVEERLATVEAFCVSAAGILRPDLARAAQAGEAGAVATASAASAERR